MKHALSRLLADYGMIIALPLLCGFFSIATYGEQFRTGESAAQEVNSAISKAPGSPRVLIAARAEGDDIAFARKIEADLNQSGAQVLGVVIGEPRDAREALQRIVTNNEQIDFIACTDTTSSWLVFSDLANDFPTLGKPAIVKPTSYMWPSFLNSKNLLNIADQVAIIAIIAIGMTIVIITGGIDLSVGSLLALCAVLAAKFIRDYGGSLEATPATMILGSVAAILICGAIGGFTGGMITRFDLPPFIVTLSMMLVSSGLAYTLSKGQSIFQIPESFQALGRGAQVLNIPNAVLLMLVLYILGHVMMTRTWLGRYIYAVGGNREAARLSGVPVRRVLMFAYIASAMLAGLGGVIMASKLKSGSATYGEMYELYVIAAVVVGGASLSGGEGKMFGTLTGAFTIAVIQNGMNLTSVTPYTQKIVLGLVILGAVLLDKIRQRK